MKKMYVSILALSCASLSFAQSPWAKGAKEGYTQLSYTTIPSYNLMFEKEGTPYELERYVVDNTIQSYTEIGIMKDFSLLLNLPFKVQSAGVLTNDTLSNPITKEGTFTGLSNVSIGLRKGFQLKSFVAAIQLKVSIATDRLDPNTGIASGLNSTGIEALYSIGKSLNEKSYFYLFAGGTYRTNSYSSNFSIGAEYGYQLFNQLWVIPNIDFVFSVRNGDVLLSESQQMAGFYLNNQEYTAIGFKFIEEINDNLGATLGLGGAFTGHNVASSPAISAGIYYKW